MQSAIQQYLKEKTIHSWASCSGGSFTTQKEIHRRITSAAPSSSFSKDNEKSQRQPQKKERSSIIDSGQENRTLIHERPMKETVFVLTSELFVCLLCFNRDITLHFQKVELFMNRKSPYFRVSYHLTVTGNHVKFARVVLLPVSEEAKT